jgi:membrane-bound lytic murein transglycosylase B
MLLPTGCTVLWAVYDEKGATVDGVADFVAEAASPESPGGWWFVPKGKMGTYIVKATVTLPQQQAPLSAPAEAKMIVQGDIVKVIIGFTGAAVPK